MTLPRGSSRQGVKILQALHLHTLPERFILWTLTFNLLKIPMPKKGFSSSSEMNLTQYKVIYRIKLNIKNTLIFSWNHSLHLLLNKSDRYTKKWGALYCCEYVSMLDLIAQNSRKKTSLRNQMSRLGCHLEKPKDCLRAEHSTLNVLRGNQNKLNHTVLTSNLCAY